ncbi:MAG TPA: hypothetical protein VFV63_03420 [Ilumatobacteraceae bacterium]|nr:hypothetical protein [Ilumatobacteraceae bacterium]
MIRTRTPHGVDSEAHDGDTQEIDAQEIEVYATGSTIITGPEHEAGEHRRPAPGGDTPVGDQLRKAVTVLHGGLEHARRFHAKSGPRMGPHPTTVATTREGTKSEIIRPVLLDPWQAWEVAGSGRLFAEPIPRLKIDRGPKPSPSTYPVWTASLRTGWVKHRAAQLQVSASPSFNVTVLELIPVTPRRTGSRSFLRVGLPVVEELARRLEAARTPHRWKRGNDGRIRDR